VKKKAAAPARQSSLRQSVSTDDIRNADDSDNDDTIVTDDEPKVLIKAETVKKAGEKRKLDIKSKKWDKVYKEAKVAMGSLEPSEY
jgi:DNA polymerase delta subunit 4